MCLYDYAATIHKIKINSKELDKLKRQKNREGYATRVDRFLFLARKNPEAAKIRRIERSIVGYDNIDDMEILDNQDNFDSTFTLDPYKIMRSGLNNAEFVDSAMLHLYLRNKFKTKNNKHSNLQEKIKTTEYDQNNQVRSSCENDEYLIKIWQETVASRKKIEQINNTTTLHIIKTIKNAIIYNKAC
ncbi:7117_t:CDS:2 [Racocetra fulgida]|uniref:7117_t:CDS:1 n=1 Tax=Racocetra fulgida TaxID=60492 RepID=A0A9N9BER2_9GLOM|nr:7117_t:CDS:2 [Racocetra fulgida]